MNDWIAFWDSDHAIFVSARHRDVHFRRIAEDISRYVPKGGSVLDYGCGEALHADVAAANASRYILCEAAPKLRETLKARFAGNQKLEVISAEQAATLDAHSLDLIVMHSVAQYLTAAEFDAALKLFHNLLKPDGVLVVGDIIPRHVSAATDALALLKFGGTDGFLPAATFGLVRTLFSSYWGLRSRLGLARYDKDEMLEILTRAGFWSTLAEHNIGHNQARQTYIGRMAPVHGS